MGVPENEKEAEEAAKFAGIISGKSEIADWVTSGMMGAPETVAFFSGTIDKIVSGLAMTVKAKRVQTGNPSELPYTIRVTLANGEVVVLEMRKDD